MKTWVALLLVLVMCVGISAAGAEQVEIVFWHNDTEDEYINHLVSEYETLHPEIKINAVVMKFEEMQTAVKMALTAGTGPDIFVYSAGPGYLGTLAKAGLLMELDQAAVDYGWDKNLAGWALEACYDEGKLYGIGSEYEILCVYYNKEIFAKLGVEIPKTYDEFVGICQKAKDAGITGLVIDDMDMWPGFHYESLMFGAFGGPELIQSVLALENENGWNQPEFAEGLNALRKLVADGYTTQFPNALLHDDALREFYTDGGAMYMSGTWHINQMVENMGEKVGLFVLPSAKPDIPSVPPVGLGSAVLVNKNARHPKETLDFLNYIYDAEGGAKIWMGDAVVITPANVDTTGMDFNHLFLELAAVAGSTSTFNANIDVLVPQNVNDVTRNYMQAVLDGNVTGEEAVKLKQDAFAQAVAEGLY